MAVLFVVNRLRALFMIVLGIIKRGLCCFRRRRRASADTVPLIAVGVVPNDLVESGVGQDMQNWNLWDESPVSIVTEQSPENTVQQQIELYRQHSARHYSESDEQPQPDFFEDMAPQITKQPKILIRDEDNNTSVWRESVSSRLELSMDPVLYNSPDLETWEETPGWEDQSREDWDPDTVLREKRHLERQRRLAEQRKKREQLKMSRPIALGAKLS